MESYREALDLLIRDVMRIFEIDIYKREYQRIMLLNGRESTLRNLYKDLVKKRYDDHLKVGETLFGDSKAFHLVREGIELLNCGRNEEAYEKLKLALELVESAEKILETLLKTDSEILRTLEEIIKINKGLSHNRRSLQRRLLELKETLSDLVSLVETSRTY